DIFSMGTMLYQLTTGKHPFEGGNDLDALRRVLECAPDPPSQVVECFRGDLEEVIMKCLQFTRGSRFSTMAQLADALQELKRKHGTMSETQVGAIVTGLLGDRRRVRRQALKDAARTLGWNVATGDSLPRVIVGPDSRPLTILGAPVSAPLPRIRSEDRGQA